MSILLPQLAKELELLTNLKGLMQRDETLSSAMLRDEDISNFRVKSFSGNELRLEKVNATQASLEKMSLSDVELLNCTFIATSAPESSWRRVLMRGSRCSGFQLQTSTLTDIAFVSCQLNLANFRFSKLKNVQFKDCALDEADFYAAELENVGFDNCSLSRTEFSGSKLKNVDFRNSEVSGVLGISSLAGAIIDSTQLALLAPLLANELKIIVKDD